MNDPGFHRVQIFEWQPVSGGAVRKWSVDLAMTLIEQLGLKPNCEMSLADAQEGLRRNALANALDFKHVAKADLNQPIILITIWDDAENGYRNIIIDGWHRIKKMVLLGRTEPLQAYILSPAHSAEVEIEDYVVYE